MSSKYEAKTKPTEVSVDGFLAAISDDAKRADAMRLREMMEKISGEPAAMWGPTIIGFGRYHYRYATGHEGDAAAVGFSPRATSLVTYVVGGYDGHEGVLARLGKHRSGTSCLYIKRLSDVDKSALSELIQVSLDSAARFHVEG